jgi:hypothetical protein
MMPTVEKRRVFLSGSLVGYLPPVRYVLAGWDGAGRDFERTVF